MSAAEFHAGARGLGRRMAGLRWMAWAGLALGAMTACVSAQPAGQSLLYNPGPRWQAGITLVRTPEGVGCHLFGSSLQEAGAVVGRPPQRGRPRKCIGGDVPGGDRPEGPTFTHDTRVGWFAADAGKVPGWKIANLGGGNGQPMTWRYSNHALATPDPCKLREVGLVYQGWPNRADSAFRLNPDGSRLRLGQFSRILARFSARLVAEEGPPRCQRMASGYITVDFRVIYYNNQEEAKTVRSDLVGVIIHLANGGSRALVQNADPAIYWKGAAGLRTNLLLRGDKLPTPIRQLGPEFQEYEIDFVPLLHYLPPPPPGMSLDDAVIVGLDIYSAVRGADITFDVRRVDLVGIGR